MSTGQQTLDDGDTVRGVYRVVDVDLPGAWRYRGDGVWHDTETDDLLVIAPGTMADIRGDDDCYQVNLHHGDRYAVTTLVDNVSLDRANGVAARYVRKGVVPDDTWLANGGGR
jgi:hypothetical protein